MLQVAVCAVLAWLATGLTSTMGWQAVRFGWRAKSLFGIALCAVLATAGCLRGPALGAAIHQFSHAAILFTLEPVFCFDHVLHFIAREARQPSLAGRSVCARRHPDRRDARPASRSGIAGPTGEMVESDGGATLS